MPNLYERLFPDDNLGNNISVHLFTAAVVDYAAGQTTRQEIITHFALDASAQTDLTALLDTLDAQGGTANKLLWIIQFDSVNIMAEQRAKYRTRAAYAQRLGIVA